MTAKRPRWRCTACGAEVMRRSEHTEADCRPPLLIGVAQSHRLSQLQRRVDELRDELGEPAREVAS
jgi:hypothetical protein